MLSVIYYNPSTVHSSSVHSSFSVARGISVYREPLLLSITGASTDIAGHMSIEKAVSEYGPHKALSLRSEVTQRCFLRQTFYDEKEAGAEMD